ncbi:MAG TPA: hypothetical protein VKM54_30090 [Myxococcota bacterium]|nr:hypothetical protein [Myxococcota bacterium]
MSHPRGSAALASAFAAVGLVGAALALPGVLHATSLTADAVGYVGAAYNLVEGHGLVDPVTYSYYLRDLRPPVPALVIRPPVVSLLFAIPLALGASLPALAVSHVIWASLVGASGVIVARRAMSSSASVAFAIAVGWSYAWVAVSRQLLSEVTACAVLLLAIVAVRDFHRSHPRAFFLGFVTWIAWLTRPNLGLLAPAAVCAAVIELGPRAAVRARPLWTYLLAFLLLYGVTVIGFAIASGVRPYAHYGLMLELLDFGELSAYRKEYVGVLAFLRAHASEVAAVLRGNAISSYRHLFVMAPYLHVGWVAVPALAYALARGGRGSLERRFAACAAVLLTASAVGVWGGFDPMRYLLPGAVCLWFTACALLGDLGDALSRRWLEPSSSVPSPVLRFAAGALPLVVVLPLWALGNAGGWLRTAPAQWRSYRAAGTLPPRNRWSETARQWCAQIDRDARVASPDPWTFYLWCGTAGIALPPDLDSADWVDRFLDEQEVGYVVVDDLPKYQALRTSPKLVLLSTRGGCALYAVRDPSPGSRPWHAPPPLASRGTW